MAREVKFSDRHMARFQYNRDYTDEIVLDAAGYVEDSITLDTQYNINSGLYLRPSLIFLYYDELSSPIKYDSFALTLTVGKRIRHNISLSLIATQTYENVNSAAIASGYTNYRETKVSFGVTATF